MICDGDDDRGFRVLCLPHVFLLILINTSLEGMHSLYLALSPADREVFFEDDQALKILRKANLELKEGVKLTMENRRGDFGEFLKFLHLHHHALVMQQTSYTVKGYQTQGFYRHPVLPPTAIFPVVSCIFLPMAAPGRFSGSLAVLGREGELVLLSPRRDCFRKIFSCTLSMGTPRSAAKTLVSSPSGKSMLATDERGLYWVHLSEEKVRCVRFDLSGNWRDLGGVCFYDEQSFLLLDICGRLWKHSLVHSEQLTGEMILGPIAMDASSGWPITYAYKRETSATSAWLVLNPRRAGTAHWNRMMFCSKEETLLFEVPECLVCNYAVHPDQEELYVVVLTCQSRKQFLSQAPVQPVHRYSVMPLVHFATGNRVGRVGVFRVDFTAPAIRLVPRFYMSAVGETGDEVLPGEFGYCTLHNLSSSPSMTDMRCSRSHLSVMAGCNQLAHLPLISGAESTVLYQRLRTRTTFCVSEDNSFFASFRGYTVGFEDFMKGGVMCKNYLDLSGDVSKFNLRGIKQVELEVVGGRT